MNSCLAGSVFAAVLLDSNQKSEKPYALIFGTVWSPEEHPVYGVRVGLRRANEKKSRWQTYSDHNGEFAFRVPAGRMDYVVTTELKNVKFMKGKELKPAEELTVKIENDERADIGLHLRH